MKRCPKCNRVYPDENQRFCTVDGGLLTSEAFDPNATMQGGPPPAERTPVAPTSRELPNLNETIALTDAPTEVLGSPTGPTGAATVIDRYTPPPPPPKPQSAPLTATSGPLAPSVASAPPTATKAKSKLPMVLGILGLLLVLGVGAVVAVFFLVIKPRLEETQREQPIVATSNENQNTSVPENTNSSEAPPQAEDEFVPPAGAVKFANSQDKLDGKLAEHYIDFSFYYPSTWEPDPKAGVPGASNFAKVERRLPPDFTQENFAVGWYKSKGTFEADAPTFPQLVEVLESNLARGFPGYRKLSEGPTKINSLDGYEFRFESVSRNTEKGDLNLWGRVVFLPTGVAGDQTGATLIMLATSLAPELSGVEDVGTKGELPVILDSFRFGKR